MKRKLAIALGLTLGALAAGEPAGVVFWPKGVPPAGAKNDVKFANHSIATHHREKDGVPEFHENQTDIIFIQTGEAAFVVGGEVVGGKTTAPGEIRGVSIKNGVKRNVGPGDVIRVPSKTPHQFFLAPGKQVTYITVKVDNP